MTDQIRMLRQTASMVPSMSKLARDPNVSDMEFLAAFHEQAGVESSIEDFAQGYGVDPADMGSFVESAHNSMLFGFADEIFAGLDTAVGNESYEKNLERRRRPLRNYQAAHPGRAVGADIAGFIVPGAAGYKALGRGLQGASMASRLGQVARIEGTLGAAHGFGSGEGGFVPRAERAAQEGAAAAVLGPVFDVGAMGVGAVGQLGRQGIDGANAFARGFRRGGAPDAPSVPPSPVSQPVTPSALDPNAPGFGVSSAIGEAPSVDIPTSPSQAIIDIRGDPVVESVSTPAYLGIGDAPQGAPGRPNRSPFSAELDTAPNILPNRGLSIVRQPETPVLPTRAQAPEPAPSVAPSPLQALGSMAGDLAMAKMGMPWYLQRFVRQATDWFGPPKAGPPAAAGPRALAKVPSKNSAFRDLRDRGLPTSADFGQEALNRVRAIDDMIRDAGITDSPWGVRADFDTTMDQTVRNVEFLQRFTSAEDPVMAQEMLQGVQQYAGRRATVRTPNEAIIWLESQLRNKSPAEAANLIARLAYHPTPRVRHVARLLVAIDEYNGVSNAMRDILRMGEKNFSPEAAAKRLEREPSLYEKANEAHRKALEKNWNPDEWQFFDEALPAPDDTAAWRRFTGTQNIGSPHRGKKGKLRKPPAAQAANKARIAEERAQRRREIEAHKAERARRRTINVEPGDPSITNQYDEAGNPLFAGDVPGVAGMSPIERMMMQGPQVPSSPTNLTNRPPQLPAMPADPYAPFRLGMQQLPPMPADPYAPFRLGLQQLPPMPPDPFVRARVLGDLPPMEAPPQGLADRVLGRGQYETIDTPFGPMTRGQVEAPVRPQRQIDPVAEKVLSGRSVPPALQAAIEEPLAFTPPADAPKLPEVMAKIEETLKSDSPRARATAKELKDRLEAFPESRASLEVGLAARVRAKMDAIRAAALQDVTPGSPAAEAAEELGDKMARRYLKESGADMDIAEVLGGIEDARGAEKLAQGIDDALRRDEQGNIRKDDIIAEPQIITDPVTGEKRRETVMEVMERIAKQQGESNPLEGDFEIDFGDGDFF